MWYYLTVNRAYYFSLSDLGSKKQNCALPEHDNVQKLRKIGDTGSHNRTGDRGLDKSNSPKVRLIHAKQMSLHY